MLTDGRDALCPEAGTPVLEICASSGSASRHSVGPKNRCGSLGAQSRELRPLARQIQRQEGSWPI